jgi:hypothetical protein
MQLKENNKKTETRGVEYPLARYFLHNGRVAEWGKIIVPLPLRLIDIFSRAEYINKNN